MSVTTFVIQFTGKDIPGLLHTWAQALCELHYNITDISLATGGSVHTTFLKCQREEVTNIEPLNPHRERLNIQRTLSDKVRDWYHEHNKAHNLADLEDEPTVLVKFDEPEDREQSFQVYLSIEVNDEPGAVANLTDLLLGAYTINSTFSRPQLKFPERRLLYTQIEHFAPIPEQQGPRPRNRHTTENEPKLHEKHTEVDKRLWDPAMQLHRALKLVGDNLPELATANSDLKEKARLVCEALNAAQTDWLLSSGETSKSGLSFKEKYAADVRYAFIVWKNQLLHECLCQPRFNLLELLEAVRRRFSTLPQDLPRVETTQPLSNPKAAKPDPLLYGHWRLQMSKDKEKPLEAHLFIGKHSARDNPESIMEATMIRRDQTDQIVSSANERGYFTVTPIRGASYVNWFAAGGDDFPDLSGRGSYEKWVKDGKCGFTILRYSCNKNLLKIWYVKDNETLKNVSRDNRFTVSDDRIEFDCLERYLDEKGGEELFNSEPDVYQRISK